MSDPALNAVNTELSVLIHAQQLHDAAAVAYATGVSASAAASEIKDRFAEDLSAEDLAAGIAAQAGLDEMLASEAPDDASIGLYNEDMGLGRQGLAANEVDAATQQSLIATDRQADALQQQQILQQDLSESGFAAATLAVARGGQLLRDASSKIDAASLMAAGAIAEIDQGLAGVAEVKLKAFVADLHDLFHAVEMGAPVAASGAAGQLQASLASPEAPPASAFVSPPSVAVAVAASNAAVQLQNLIAAAQSGDLAEAAGLAQTLRAQVAQMQGMSALIAPPALSAAAMGLSMLDLDVNPLLLVFQASLLLGVKTTLNKPRKPVDDHIVILAIPALGLCELHEDGRQDD